MTTAREVYDYYKGTLVGYMGATFLCLTIAWPHILGKAIFGLFAALLCVWAWKIVLNTRLGQMTKLERKPHLREYRASKIWMPLFLVPAFAVSMIGQFKYGLGRWEGATAAAAVFMALMTLATALYLLRMRASLSIES